MELRSSSHSASRSTRSRGTSSRGGARNNTGRGRGRASSSRSGPNASAISHADIADTPASNDRKEESKEERKHHEEKAASHLSNDFKEPTPPRRITTSTNLDFLKTIRLKEDGSNLEPWLYKLEQAYSTTQLYNSVNLQLKMPGSEEVKTFNVLKNRSLWGRVSSLSEKEVEAALPDNSEKAKRHVNLAHMYSTHTLSDGLITYIRDKPKHPAVSIATIANHFKPKDHLETPALPKTDNFKTS
jgi:hypothetical protein